MQDFHNLKVWQKAHELALLAYKLTADFPREETFGLRHSIRKTAVDIPAYIAEGAGKTNDAEFAAAISFALALAMRLEYYALIARDLELMEPRAFDTFNSNVIEIKKMLAGFKRTLAKLSWGTKQ